MASCDKTPSPVDGLQQQVFKVPPVPRKNTKKKQFPISKVLTKIPETMENKINSSSSSSLSSSPCVQLGQKRATFPFSPAVRMPNSNSDASSNSRFFCEDDWLAWKNGIEKLAVRTSVGPRPPTPPTWIATPHRSSLFDYHSQKISNDNKYAVRRRLMALRLDDSDTKTGRNESVSSTSSGESEVMVLNNNKQGKKNSPPEQSIVNSATK